MMFRLLCVLLLMSAVIGQVTGQQVTGQQVNGQQVIGENAEQATAAQMEQTAQQLFQKLESGSSAQRDEVEQELIALGPELLEYVPAITDATSESLRARLMRIRSGLEKEAAKASAVPTRVSLQGTMRLSEALNKIAEQTGNRILDNRDSYGGGSGDPEIETDLDDVTFWEAVETVLDRGGMAVDPYVLEPRSLGFVSRPDGQTPAMDRVSHRGRFRFEALRTESFCDLRNPDQRYMRLGLEISWEPSVAPVAIVFIPDSVKAEDDGGRPLELNGPDSAIELPVHETGSAVEFDLPFQLPDPQATSIATLSGDLQAMIPGQMARFEFEQLDKPQTQSKGGIKVMLKRVRESQNLIDVWVIVQFENADESLQSRRGWVYNNPAILIGPDGTRHDFVGMDTFRQADAEFGLSYKYDLTGDLTGYRFTYETPAAILEIPVEYALSDIQLP